jgi:putative inorganic carbon (HCO3(-)) transporter
MHSSQPANLKVNRPWSAAALQSWIGLNYRAWLVAQLPSQTLALWASIFFTFSVWTYVVSLAASQTLLLLAGVFYAAHLLRDKPLIVFPPVVFPLLLLCMLTVLSVAFAGAPTPGWFAVRKLVLFLILLLTANLVVSRRHLQLIFEVLFVESALVGIVAGVQFVSRYHATRITHPHDLYRLMAFEQRVQGLMGHWMNFSGQQMLILSALLAFIVLRPAKRKLWWLALAVIATSVLLSLTRGVWVGCFIAGTYLIGISKPRWLLAIPILIGLAYLRAPYLLRERMNMALHPRTDVALSIRLQMWQVGFRMMRAHPWLGVGPDDIERDYALYLRPGEAIEGSYHGHLHNNFIELGAERGLPALAAWIWFMALLGWYSFVRRKGLGESRWIAHAAIACWLAFVVEGFFEFNFGTSPVLMMFLFMAAVPFAAESIEMRESQNYGEAVHRVGLPG